MITITSKHGAFYQGDTHRTKEENDNLVFSSANGKKSKIIHNDNMHTDM